MDTFHKVACIFSTLFRPMRVPSHFLQQKEHLRDGCFAIGRCLLIEVPEMQLSMTERNADIGGLT
jgi:hypothetical protein